MPWLVTTGPAALHAGTFGIAFVVLALSVGRRLLIWLSIGKSATPLERGVLAMAVGAGALQFLPFVLGVAGVMTTKGVCVASAIVALAASYDATAVLKRAWLSIRSLEAQPIWLRIWLLTLLPGLGLALLSALTPVVDPDGLGYHLTVPKRWLATGSVGYLPTYPYSNTPMGVEMLFTLGMAWAGDAAAKLVHFSLGITAAFGLWATARRVANELLAALAVSLFFYGPFGVVSLMGWAYVEAATAAALVGSGLAWLIWYQGREASFLRVAGLLAGLGVSFKMTAGLFPVALAALTLLLLWNEQRAQGKPLAPSLRLLSGFLLLVALPVLPWLTRSALLTGNPFFPMFAKLIPSRDFSALQSRDFDQYNRYMVWGVGAGAHWGLGLRKAILAAVAAVVALVGGLAYRRQRSFPARATVLVILSTVLIQLGAAGLYKRYWVPVLSVLELPMLLLLVPWLSAAWVRPALLGMTALLSLFGAKQVLAGVNNDAAGLVKVPLGLEPQQAFLDRQLPLLPLYEMVNRDAPANAGVVLAAYCGGFHIDRTTFCADIVQSALRVSSWAEFTADLRRLGVTHVIAPRDWEAPLATLEAPPLEVGNTSFLIRHQEHVMIGRLLREHGRLLAPASDQGLYAIDLSAAR
jgi:hypothetical protein